MRRSLFLGLLSATALIAAPSAADPITADATLELTITLIGVTITDTVSGNSTPATFETSNEPGDVLFEDVGPNGNTFGGGSGNNPPGSVGSDSATETVLLNGLDVFIDDYDMDSFGIGDSLVTTMETFASAETPGSVFFAQVDSDNSLYFSTFGEETDRYTFSFDYSASLVGTLDSSALPGVSLAFGEGEEVTGEAENTLAGPPSSFQVLGNFFNLGTSNNSNGVQLLDEMASGSFDVAFDAGDNPLGITFSSSLIVNARVDAAPQLEGDFNADGVVDAADYTVWRDNESGDFTPGDYDTWRQNYGASNAPAAAVPEPGSLLLVTLSLTLAASLAARGTATAPTDGSSPARRRT